MRSTTKTNFPTAISHVRAQNIEALDKLDDIGRQAVNAGRRLQRAVSNCDAHAVDHALYHLSSLGSCVNSWSE
jgi:hypothetical protein